MQPTYISVANLFGVQARYTVPLFQRPYVWSRTEQWEPLWDDVEGLLRRVLMREGAKPVAGHFLGTVVLEQAPTPTGALPCRQIIDGQQRLTTLQILLKAAEHAMQVVSAHLTDADSAKAAGVAADQLAPLTRNPFTSTPDEAYKVWPTNEDRAPFRSVMDATVRLGAHGHASRMAEAYDYFRATLIDWLTGPSAAARAVALSAALRDHLRLIVLDLDDTDEPQAIFETLNAHGTPLLPADLMKNWLLWEAAKQKLVIGELYADYWRPFDADADYWRERVGVGHAARARVDTFLQNWLTRHVREPVSTKHLYDRFLRFAANGAVRDDDGVLDVPALLESIRDDAQRYRHIDAPTGTTRFDEFLRRLQRLDMVVFHPFIPAVMSRPGCDAADRDRIGVALESYLVRRMVCGEQTRGYGTLALALLDVLARLDPALPAADAVIATLDAGERSTLGWPSDDAFRREWMTRRFFGYFRRDRVLMVLQALEQHYQTGATLAEPVPHFDFGQLQIEHILPQSWYAHWPLPPGAGGSERDAAFHGIGNLTLVGGKLNPTLSNAPWLPTEGVKGSKRAAVAEHSKLELNARLVKRFAAHWDESTIRERASELFEAARQIWPAPDTI